MLQDFQQQAAIEEYKQDLAIFNRHRDALKKLEKKEKVLFDILKIVYAILFFIVALQFIELHLGFLFLTFLICCVVVGLIVHIKFVSNLLSLGRHNELLDEIKLTKDLIDNVYKKLEPFEKAVRDHYESELFVFYEANLYRKRSGNQQFEDSLSEFASMIRELSVMNSNLITTSIYLSEYKDYLKKRMVHHRIQSSKSSDRVESIRNVAKSFVKAKEPEPKKTIPPEQMYRKGRKIDNWDEINKKRKLTGTKGEEIVFAMEQEYLSSINRSDLAGKVSHVAKKEDGLGYDVISFFSDGREKYIEVKSTTVSLDAPYYISRNELQFLKENPETSFVYRVLVSADVPQIKIYSNHEVLEMHEIVPVQFLIRKK